ncbi:hypothetical protein CR203_17190 [Salipaludibacillus neizhouensis]|uniref:Uncharacterized protein n=1 Tax=Salipaludibacillus neizhouensis TaxID=885475 RepID=A0A3A9JYR2_9BACI|nr:hypothetical protein [Salipaludibacillus neizhouensis]RKL66034.1 hypothetical protein CR203_17190 [Salipaludibacillus neizhouensis]
MSDDKKEITEQMEKSLHLAHGFGHEVYKKSLDKKIEVEQKREKEYLESLKVNKELIHKINR